MDGEDQFNRLFIDSRVNAILSWILVGIFGLVIIESAITDDLRWVIFTTALFAIVIIPPVHARSANVMLPWELLLIASVPVTVRALEVSALANLFTTCLSISAIALIIISQLHVLSSVRVTHWFAILTVVLATLAAAGAWAIIRWNLDQYTGTEFLTDNTALMVEFGWAVVAGLFAGALFKLYFRPRAQRLRRQLRGVLPR